MYLWNGLSKDCMFFSSKSLIYKFATPEAMGNPIALPLIFQCKCWPALVAHLLYQTMYLSFFYIESQGEECTCIKVVIVLSQQADGCNTHRETSDGCLGSAWGWPLGTCHPAFQTTSVLRPPPGQLLGTCLHTDHLSARQLHANRHANPVKVFPGRCRVPHPLSG